MQKSSAIQKTESIIRRQLYAKGHVARYTFEDIIGESQAIKTAIHSARNYSAVTSNIMIVGDTGTGKEMFAQGMHNRSDRREAPLVAINCAALSKSLLESELFGYAEGAFTGALKGGKQGIFEIAHTGTIFLDEISEIPPDVQARLLRVLQERQIMRLGDDKVIPIDVRIICAANKPLLQEVRGGRFRKDLYYRLAVLTLNLPGLNARGSDILRLAEFFIREYCEKFRKPEIVLSEAARARLLQHRWKGNIRELRNVCECLVVLNESGVLAREDLDAHFASEDCGPAIDEGTDYAEDLRLFNREQIVEALESCGGNKVRAVKKLGVSKATIWRWIKKMEIEK